MSDGLDPIDTMTALWQDAEAEAVRQRHAAERATELLGETQAHWEQSITGYESRIAALVERVELQATELADTRSALSVAVAFGDEAGRERDRRGAELVGKDRDLQQLRERLAEVLEHPSLALGVAVREPIFSEEDDRGCVDIIGYHEEPEGKWRRETRELVARLGSEENQ